MTLKTKILLYLALLALFDTLIPIPMTTLVLIYVCLQRPAWFRQWVDDIYRT